MMPFIWNQPPFNRFAMTDIFISYSHKDEAWKDALQRHLKVLQTHNAFSIWDDRQIEVGANWLPVIEGAIEQAKVALLLVSSDFLTSEFVTRQEIPRFLQRREAEGLQVVPIIIHPCAWVTVPWLAALQGGTKDNRPLAQFALGSFESEQAFSEITLKVYNLLQAAQQAAELKRLAELSRLAEQERLEQARLQREAEARRLAQEEAEREATEQLKQAQATAKKAEQERFKREQAESNRLERERQKAEQGESSSGKKSTWLWGGIGASALLGAVVWAMQSKPTETPLVQPSTTVSSTAAIETTPTPEKVAEPDKPTIPLPEMITIQGGSFEMGCSNSKDCSDDEKPVRTVQVAAFEMSKTEVTFAQWDACVADGGCGGYKPDDEQWGRGNRPVINVSWNDAQNYVQWLSQKTGQKYRLPTEVEWEYAARAGTTTSYFWGNEIGNNQANCDGCGSEWDNKQTAPVERFAANAWGLHDMHGNVWEWVQDCYHETYIKAPKDGRAWEEKSCVYRVWRGGSWINVPRYLRSAARNWINPAGRINSIGFRISRTF
jgi:formylglycine-generating enzyme required for sulfatase activity